MRFVMTLSGIILMSAAALGQTRAELAGRFGLPRSEIFLLPQNVKLTATYDDAGSVCTFRIETSDHSERAAPNLSDVRFWMDSDHVSRLIGELVPESARRGVVESQLVGLRVGEHMRVETDDGVQISRIQRSRRLVTTSEIPVADRLVKIAFRRLDCPELN